MMITRPVTHSLCWAGVCELLLMRSVLPLEEYAGWAMSFAPSLADATSCALLKAPKVSDPPQQFSSLC